MGTQQGNEKDQSFIKQKLNMSLLEREFWQGFIAAFTGWASSFFVPIGPFFGIVLFLVVADLLTGIRAAVKRKERISSSGFRRTVEKIVLYCLAIFLSEGMKNVFMPFAPVTYITAFAIALTEFKSNIENIETVTGVNIWASIKGYFEKIQPPRNGKKE